MNTKTSLYVCCSLSAAAGLGYAAGHFQNERHAIEQESTEQASRHVSQSGGLRKTMLSEPVFSLSNSDKQKTSLDALLRRYDKFTPAQIEKELNRLRGLNMFDLSGISKNTDIRVFSTIFYLSYKWGRQAPEQALAYMQSAGSMKGFGTLMIMQGWMDSDPAAATIYWTENRKSLGRDADMLRMVTVAFAKGSTEEALKWISTLDPKDKKAALPTLVSAIAEARPEELKSLAARLTPEEANESRIYRILALKWAARDWDYAKECISKLPQSQQTYATGDALAQLSRNDLKKATSEFRKLPSGAQFIAALCMLPAISEKSPVKAVDWLAKNAVNEQMFRLAGVALGNTAQSQSEELAAHIEKMPEGTTRQSFLSGLVQQTIQVTRRLHSRDYPVDFDRALSLSTQIQDETERNQSTQTLLQSWIQSAPAEAAQWLATSSLSQEIKDSCKKQCEDALRRGENSSMLQEQGGDVMHSVSPFAQIIGW